jgi:hypothetical protein
LADGLHLSNHFFLLAGAPLFDEKIRQSAALISLGLRDFLLTSRDSKNNCCLSRIFGERFGEKITVCAHTTRLPKK